MLYTVGAKDFRSELMRLMGAKPDAILCDIYTGDAIIIQKQLFEMGVRDFSKFYHYNLSAMAGVPDPKLIEGLKGASYTTAGPRAAMMSCGGCSDCVGGKPNLCGSSGGAKAAGTLISGKRKISLNGKPINHATGISCFAEYAVVSRNSVVPIDKALEQTVEWFRNKG